MYIKTWKVIFWCALALAIACTVFVSARNYVANHYDHQYTQR